MGCLHRLGMTEAIDGDDAHLLPSCRSCSFHARVGGGKISVSADSWGSSDATPCPKATACVERHIFQT